MLVFHLILLWSGIFFLAKSAHNLKSYYLTFFIPVIPNIFVYAGTIWKDVGFAFSYFFTLSFLG